jgi:hypothetical protein
VTDRSLRRATTALVTRRAPGSGSVVAAQLQAAVGVDGVVAAPGVLGGGVAGVAGQGFVDRDDAQPGVELLERR